MTDAQPISRPQLRTLARIRRARVIIRLSSSWVIGSDGASLPMIETLIKRGLCRNIAHDGKRTLAITDAWLAALDRR